jgi:hypothetical protein
LDSAGVPGRGQRRKAQHGVLAGRVREVPDHHLEQRVPAGRPGWVDQLDGPLERQRGMFERGQVGVAHPAQQFG